MTRVKEWVRVLVIVVLAGVLTFGTVGCGGRSQASEAESEEGSDADDGVSEEDAEEEEAAPVEVVELGRGPIEAVLRFSADLDAEHAVSVYSQAARRVVRLLVEEGDVVSKGQLLAALEDEEQRNALARVESQAAKSKRDYERQRSLYDQQLISEELFNQATYDLEQLELALADARRELGYTEIRAPIAGTVTQRLVDIGDTVTLNQHLFDLVDFDSLVVRLYVPERDLARVVVGQPTRLVSQAVPGVVFAGEIDRIAPVVDPRTGTVKTTVRVPFRPGLRPGMFLQVEIVTAVRDDALLVPKRALVLDDDQVYVFRVKADETAERLLIHPVLQDTLWVEVREVLAEGDRVVVAGQAGLKPGDEVRVVGRKAAATAESTLAEDAGEAGEEAREGSEEPADD